MRRSDAESFKEICRALEAEAEDCSIEVQSTGSVGHDYSLRFAVDESGLGPWFDQLVPAVMALGKALEL